MSLAAETREAARRHPFLLAGLRADVVNYTAAARFLDVDGDSEAVATALRRFAAELDERDTERREARVTMQRGVGVASWNTETEAGEGAAEDLLMAVGGVALAPDAGDLTAVLAAGEVDARALVAAVDRLHAQDVDVQAAGVAGDALLVAVGGRDGATAVRVVEDVLDGVPVR